MATTALDTELPTFADMVKAQDPDGTAAKVIPILEQYNAFLPDAVVQEGNLATGHLVTTEHSLPGVTWRMANQGVDPTKGTTRQYTETAGQMATICAVDVDVAKLNGNAAAYRFMQDKMGMRALSNELESGIVYHSSEVTPEKFDGLAKRLDSTTGEAGDQIINFNGSASGSDQASIYLVCWGPESAFLFYPKGQQGGLVHNDTGEQWWEDGSGRKFRAYVSELKWNVGLCVADRRQVVRIANIDTSALASTGKTLINAMIQAYHQLYDPKMGRCAFYTNRNIATYLHLQAVDSTTNSTLSIQEIGGKPITTFLGLPVRTSDALTNTEAIVS